MALLKKTNFKIANEFSVYTYAPKKNTSEEVIVKKIVYTNTNLWNDTITFSTK